MVTIPTWIDSYLFGKPNVQFNGVALPWEPVVNFIGGTVADNPGQTRIDVTFPGAASPRYPIGFSFTGGVLGNSQLLGMHVFSKAVTIPANFGSYSGYATEASGTANATSSTAILVQSASSGTGSWTTIGTITIASSSVTPTFTTVSGTAKNFTQGQCLQVIGPSTADATFANFFCTLIGFET